MATTTTNFGWDIPQSTDLVKDGATAIAALGQDIDTALVDLKGGTTGQILSKASATDLDYTWISNDVGDITGVTATSPLTGGGTSGAVTVGIQDASTSQKGSVQLSDSTSTTSSVLAATPTAVKAAYDPAFTNNFYAGKNKIINGDFRFNQRGFTSTTTNATYGFDRFLLVTSDGTVTYTPQTFTLGAAPVAGYEGTNFAQIVTTGQTLTTATAQLVQRIESVRTFAGQTVTVSFWAKANTGTPNVVVNLAQFFGSTGSPSATVETAGTVQAITTSWARYSFTIAVPSISGKTLGTAGNDRLQVQIYVSAGSATNAPTVGLQSNTFQIWGVQAEAGSTATPFQTASGSVAGELALCQRYYQKSYAQTTAVPTNAQTAGQVFAPGSTISNNGYYIFIQYQVTMRTQATVTIYSYTSSTAAAISNAGGTDLAANTGTTNFQSDKGFTLTNTSGGSAVPAQGGFVFHYQAVAEL